MTALMPTNCWKTESMMPATTTREPKANRLGATRSVCTRSEASMSATVACAAPWPSKRISIRRACALRPCITSQRGGSGTTSGRPTRRKQEDRARDQQAPLATESFTLPTGHHRPDDAAEQRARYRPPRQAAAGGFGQIQWLDEIRVNGTDGA